MRNTVTGSGGSNGSACAADSEHERCAVRSPVWMDVLWGVFFVRLWCFVFIAAVLQRSLVNQSVWALLLSLSLDFLLMDF